jgi:hypothetical protein
LDTRSLDCFPLRILSFSIYNFLSLLLFSCHA